MQTETTKQTLVIQELRETKRLIHTQRHTETGKKTIRPTGTERSKTLTHRQSPYTETGKQTFRPTGTDRERERQMER